MSPVTIPALTVGVSAPGVTTQAPPSPASPAPSTTGIIPPYPQFVAASDGPLLAVPRRVALETSAGIINVELDPALAPIHATQVYKLMMAGAYDGTTFYRYQAAFVVQLSPVNVKAPGLPPILPVISSLLRRLPLEVEAQRQSVVRHERWVLSMARYDDNDTAVSSFSIMLGSAPHLDQKYTVFGRMIPDQESSSTIDRITRNWSDTNLPWIVKVRETVGPAPAPRK